MAVKIVIDSFPNSISSDTFEIAVTISGAKTGTNYLRAEIYKDGTTKYFGETFNGSEWYGGSDGLRYYPVDINGASTSASFKVRMGNPDKNDYTGSGEYKLKIKRYTASGNAASGDEENAVTLLINYNIQTSTPIPTATPTPIPTVIPTIIAAETVLPTYFKEKATSLPTSAVKVLAESTVTSPSPTFTALSHGDKAAGFPYLSLILIFGGILLLSVSFWPIAREKFKAYNVRNAQKSN